MILVFCGMNQNKNMILFYEQICIDAFSPEYNESPKATAPLLGRKGNRHPRFGHKHTNETKEKGFFN